jgi:tetratricopeptide (TPR) repeat protein
MTGAILILGLAYYYTNDDNAAVSADAKKQEIPRTPSEMAFAKLTIEQQALVKQTYELARSLYTQQKYELARQELLKVQSILPEYLDSKELENFINQALQIISEQQRNELIEKAKAENEIKISITVESCKKLVNPFVEMNRIDDCLSPVVSLNPDHPKIIALKSEVEELITKRKLDEDKNREIREKAKKLKALFEKAKNVEATESGEKAIKAYQEVVRSSLPDIEGLKYLARGRISQITLMMKNKMNDLIAQGDKAILDKNMKAAILAYQKALEIDRFNLKIKTKYEELLNEMRKQMMVPYQEAVLEESVGEVDSAKNRWKKIREQSVPEEEYFQKATIKLKKYGAL